MCQVLSGPVVKDTPLSRFLPLAPYPFRRVYCANCHICFSYFTTRRIEFRVCTPYIAEKADGRKVSVWSEQTL